MSHTLFTAPIYVFLSNSLFCWEPPLSVTDRMIFYIYSVCIFIYLFIYFLQKLHLVARFMALGKITGKYKKTWEKEGKIIKRHCLSICMSSSLFSLSYTVCPHVNNSSSSSCSFTPMWGIERPQGSQHSLHSCSHGTAGSDREKSRSV